MKLGDNEIEERKYLIADGSSIVARDMDLSTALLLLKVMCEEYYLEDILKVENIRD